MITGDLYNTECEYDKMIVVTERLAGVIYRDSDGQPFTKATAQSLAERMNWGNKPEYAHDAQVGIIRIISHL